MTEREARAARLADATDRLLHWLKESDPKAYANAGEFSPIGQARHALAKFMAKERA